MEVLHNVRNKCRRVRTEADVAREMESIYLMPASCKSGIDGDEVVFRYHGDAEETNWGEGGRERVNKKLH